MRSRPSARPRLRIWRPRPRRPSAGSSSTSGMIADAGAELVHRAQAAGFSTLILTVDTPVAGARLRDVRNGFTIPPTLSVRTLFDIGVHPGWWFNLLTTEPLQFATFTETQGTVADLIDRVFDPTITIADLGVVTPDVDGTDRDQGHPDRRGRRSWSPTPASTASSSRTTAVANWTGPRRRSSSYRPSRPPSASRVEVLIDGGVLGGADIIAAIAMGARAVCVGRAYLYGLMAGGERGVHRSAELLQREAVRPCSSSGSRASRTSRPSACGCAPTRSDRPCPSTP